MAQATEGEGKSVGFARGYWLVGVAALAALAALAFGWWFRGSEGSLERVVAASELRVGYAVEAPYAFPSVTGEVQGEAALVVTHVAKALGISKVTWVQTSFDALIPELQAGRFDVIASGMFVTGSRRHRVAFSIPTFQVAAGLLVLKQQVARFDSCAAVREQPGVRIAVLAGGVEDGELRRCGIPAEQLLVVPDAATGRAAVESGAAEALALSQPTVRWMAAQPESGAKLEVRPGLTDRVASGGFAFRRADRALREAWDEVLRVYLRSEPHYEGATALGFTREELATDLRSPELVAP